MSRFIKSPGPVEGEFVRVGLMVIATFSWQTYCVLRDLIEIVLHPYGHPAGASYCALFRNEKMDVHDIKVICWRSGMWQLLIQDSPVSVIRGVCIRYPLSGKYD